MPYEGSFQIYVFPVISKDMDWEKPLQIQLGCHTEKEANKHLSEALIKYPNRHIVLIHTKTITDENTNIIDQTEKVIAIS